MWQIGPVELSNRVFMAPMAGVTDLPYRLLAKEQGCALVYSELISAKGLAYGNRRSLEMLDIAAEERPVGLQIFGGDPAIMAEAARIVADRSPDILDINMGCPVPKVTRNDEGCALMKDPAQAGRVVRAVVDAVNMPVSVKIRKGWDEDNVTAVEVAQRLQDAGAAAIGIHGRTREQYYSGRADWEIIRRVKSAVQIPVIGNGDVERPVDAARLLDETGCDAIMIGRACLGNPWIFRQVLHYLDTGGHLPGPSAGQRVEAALRHLRMAVVYKGERVGIREMRKQMAWYLKGLPRGNPVKQTINRLNRLTDVEELLEKYLVSLQPEQQAS